MALLKLRQRSVVERKIKAGEIKHKSGVGFVYTANEELEYKVGDKDGDDDEDSNDGSDDDDEDKEKDVVKKSKKQGK